MATVAQLAERPHRAVAYLLVVEGWPWAFTDRPEISGAGFGSWIGEAYGVREVLEGLTVPASITFATNPENGMLASDDGATFTIRDFKRRMISLVNADNAGTIIGETLGPKDDPAPASIFDAQLNAIALHDRWINNEAIGPNGQRRWYGCMPITLAGQDHAAASSETQTLAPSILRTSPAWYAGTRCALYMVYQDTDTGEWPAWQAQHDGGGLLWWGTTTELACESLTWEMACDGPSSWLRRQLGSNRADAWSPVWSFLTLSADPGAREDHAAFYFSYQSGAPSFTTERGAASYYAVADTLPAAGTASTFRAALQARLNTVAGTAGPDCTWSTVRNASCTFAAGRIEMRVDAFNFGALAYVCLHEKVWRLLGYSPRPVADGGQAAAFPGNDARVIDFVQPEDLSLDLAGFAAAPGPGYYLARLSTVPKQYDSVLSAGADSDGDGKPRNFLAIMDEDLTTLNPEAKQEIRVGLGGVGPYIQGQTCRPPVEHVMSNGGGNVDSVAFAAFRGSYRTSLSDDVSTMAALARVGFADDNTGGGHGPTPDIDSYRKLYISDYIDARFVGIDRTFDGPWSSFDLEWAPVNYLGYNIKNGDRADLIILRTLLSTGTASWSGYDGQGATLTLGSNAHPAADVPQGSDAEIADLGLAIPVDLIDAASFVATANTLPNGGKNSPLNRCKFAWIGGFDSEAFLWRVLEQRAWGMGLVGGRYRLFSRPQVLDLGDAELSFGPDDFAAEPDFVETADLCPFLPMDGYEVTYGVPLVEGTGSERDLVEKTKSLDPQVRTRRTRNVMMLDGAGLIPTRLWDFEPGAPPSWVSAWSRLMGGDLCNWFAQPWVTVELPLRWSVGRRIGPGSVVSFSSLYAPNREGTYGLSNRIGRVLSTTTNLEDLSVVARILVQPGDAGQLRRFAPVAWVLDVVSMVEARHNSARRTFYCHADFYSHEQGTSDVAWFAEPVWSTVGGAALVQGWQWNGRTWAQTFSFTVASVDTVAHTVTYSNTITGTWHEAQPTVLVLAPYDLQPPGSWPQAVFSVITDSDGTFGGALTAGFPLVDQ